ncbi:hypothetical protein AAFF_G00064370 [Aldrovandia affinis]|uniref:BTB domain-containing protein n=1 Tax=Aldrovandia affinis TaxID=143900 RepID=A0AAD7T3M5_9TELE|nr:hypothetical protein AAFF_G00064370 [Aldrovandia affinis]
MEPRIRGLKSGVEAKQTDVDPEQVEEMERGTRLESDTYAQRLLRGAGSLWQQVALCDVTLEAGGAQFPAHRVILASVSGYFRLLFTGRPALSLTGGPVRLQGVSARGLERVLGLIYRGHMTLSLDVVEETLWAAQTLLVRDAIKLCLRFLDVSLSPETCPQILDLARRLGPPQLHRRALEYLGAYCQGLLRDPQQLLGLDPEALLELLGRDNLGDASEADLLRGALQWLDHHPEHAAHARVIVGRVRLPLIPPETLLDELGERPPGVRRPALLPASAGGPVLPCTGPSSSPPSRAPPPPSVGPHPACSCWAAGPQGIGCAGRCG